MAEHILPQELISDRDKLLILKYWKALMAQPKVKYNLSMIYYPQIDGQTKQIN